jgi:nitrate reductase NapAB chaperone NapD
MDEKELLLVVLDTQGPTQRAADRIEQIRKMPGVLAVKTVPRLIAETLSEPAVGGE